jgi:hypothetical protein
VAPHCTVGYPMIGTLVSLVKCAKIDPKIAKVFRFMDDAKFYFPDYFCLDCWVPNCNPILLGTPTMYHQCYKLLHNVSFFIHNFISMAALNAVRVVRVSKNIFQQSFLSLKWHQKRSFRLWTTYESELHRRFLSGGIFDVNWSQKLQPKNWCNF